MSDLYATYNGYEENYRKNYEKMLPMLERSDFLENAKRLGASVEGDSARIAFLGRDYLVNKSGTRAADGKPADASIRGVLIYYTTSQGAGGETGEFALLNRLTGMIDGHKGLTKDMMHVALLREFGEDIKRFDEAIVRAGGKKMPQESVGKHTWQLRVLPHILMQFVFYEADAEFPAEYQIMFDSSAPRYLEFECLAFLTGAVARELSGNPDI